MNIKRTLVIFAISLVSTGCAFMPQTDRNQPYASNCEMMTKKLTLDKPKSASAFSCQKNMHGGDFLGCLVFAGIIVPAGSLIISGSIVLINNSLHWLEYQGSCDKKDIAQNPQSFTTLQTTQN